MTNFKFLSNSHVSMHNKDGVTLNVFHVARPASRVTALRVVKLRVERGETRSTSYVVRELQLNIICMQATLISVHGMKV